MANADRGAGKTNFFISFNLDDQLWENEELLAAHPAGFAFLTAIGALHIKTHLMRVPKRKIEKPARKILGRKWRTHYETILQTGLIVENPDDTVTVPYVLKESKLKVWRDAPTEPPPQLPPRTTSGKNARVGTGTANKGGASGRDVDPFGTPKVKSSTTPSRNAPSWFKGDTFVNVAGHQISVYEETGYRYCHTCESLIMTVESNYHGAFDYDYVSKEWN